METPHKKIKIEQRVVESAVVTPSAPSATSVRVEQEQDKKLANSSVPSNLVKNQIGKQDFTRLRILALKYRTEFLLKKFERYLLRSSPNHSPVSPVNARLVMRQSVALWRGRGVRYDSP